MIDIGQKARERLEWMTENLFTVIDSEETRDRLRRAVLERAIEDLYWKCVQEL